MPIINLTDEQVKKIVEAKIVESADKLDEIKDYIPKARFNEVNDKLKASTDKVSTYEKQLKDTENLLKDNKELKGKYDSLNTQYQADLAAKDKEIVNTSKRFMMEGKLRTAGAKHPELLFPLFDMEKVSIENGNLLGFDDQLEAHKKTYADQFTTTEVTNNSSGAGGNNNTGGSNDNLDNIDWEAELNKVI